MDKIDIHHSETKYLQAVEHLKRDVSPRNYKLIKDFLDASAIGKTARKNARIKQVGIRARVKNIFLLKVIAKFMDKPLDEMTVEDMERLIRALNSNTIKKETGKPYSEQTKSNMKITFKTFLRYYIKNQVEYESLTDWIDTRYKKKDIPSLSEEDVMKMLNKSITPLQKVVVDVLFDGGMRIEEFLNERIGDVTEVKGQIPYYRITVRNETSKTLGRTINLLWKPTTDILRNWLEQHPDKDNLDAPLFPTTYGGVRKILFVIGKRALGRSVNAHLLRHSSATYYAGQGYDYFSLCKRCGWEIGSKMPQTYIDRSGIKEKEQVNKFIESNVKDLSEKVEILQREKIKESEENEELKKKLQLLASKLLTDLSKEERKKFQEVFGI